MINMNNKNNLKVLALGFALFLNTGLVCAACTSGNKPESNNNEANEVVSEDNLRALAAVLPKYSLTTWGSSFHDGLAAVQDNSTELWGYIDKEGNEVIPCKYYSANAFNDGVAIVCTDENTSFCIDREGNVLFRLDTDNNYYSDSGFQDGLLAFCNQNPMSDNGEFKLGFLDKKGNIAIAPSKYYVLWAIGGYPKNADFSEGLCCVGKNGKSVYIDTKGNEAIITNYDYYGGDNFSDGLAYCESGFMDKTGKIIIQGKYDNAGRFSEGYAFVEKNGKWGIIDKHGNEVTPFQFEFITYDEDTEGEELPISTFHEGLAWVARNGLYGYVDTKGNVAIPFRYKVEDSQATYDFHQGLARVCDVTTNKYGFIDKQGKEVFSCQFDEAEDISEGLAVVKRGEQYGFINTEGKSTFDF